MLSVPVRANLHKAATPGKVYDMGSLLGRLPGGLGRATQWVANLEHIYKHI